MAVPDADFLLRLLRKALSRGGDYADVFVEHREITSLVLEDGGVRKASTGTIAGLGIRLLYKGKTAYSYTNDFSRPVLDDLADSLAMISDETPRDLVTNLNRRKPDSPLPERSASRSAGMGDKVRILQAGDRRARAADGRIGQVRIHYHDSVQDVTILTSEGVFVEDRRTHSLGSVNVIARQGNVIQTGIESAGGHAGFEIFDEYPVEMLAERAAARAVMMLGARRIPGGRMAVVISSEAGGTMIHEAIGHGLEGDLTRQRVSIFSGRIGEAVASALVTVIDDATLPGRNGSYAFDDEGTPSQRNVLVRDGILCAYLYDRYNALYDQARPTGNGRRQSYEYRPIPRMTNTFIAPGTSTPDDVIASVHKGLYVKKMGGGQVNTVTGEFVFQVQEGYLLENGQVGEPVRGATIAGNGAEVMRSIDMVGSDLGFSIGTCGKDGQGVPVSDALPTIRIPEMVVGGETA